MKLIIAGSRRVGLVPSQANPDLLVQGRLDDLIDQVLSAARWTEKVTEVISGGAAGVDRAGELWAQAKRIPIRQFLPDWNGYAGKRAGLVRNVRMADYAYPDGALLAIWDGRSKGTKHMIEQAQQRGLKVFVHVHHGQ